MATDIIAVDVDALGAAMQQLANVITDVREVLLDAGERALAYRLRDAYNTLVPQVAP